MPGVRDLIVVLHEHAELVPGLARRRLAVAFAAVGRVPPVVDEALGDRFRDVGQLAELLEIAVARPRHRGDDGVVEVVAPLCVEAEAVSARRAG